MVVVGEFNEKLMTDFVEELLRIKKEKKGTGGNRVPHCSVTNGVKRKE